MTFLTNHHKKHAFTLVEIIVAIAIFSSVSALLIGSFIYWLYGFNRVETRMKQVAEVSFISSEMRDDTVLITAVNVATENQFSISRDGKTYTFDIAYDPDIERFVLIREVNDGGVSQPIRLGSEGFGYTFNYLDEDNNVLPFPITNNQLSQNAIQALRLDVTVSYPKNQTKTVSFEIQITYEI